MQLLWGEEKRPKSVEENDGLLHFSRDKQQLQAIVIQLSWPGNGKHNCRVKKMNLFITSNGSMVQL